MNSPSPEQHSPRENSRKQPPQSKVLEKGIWGMSGPMFVDQAVTYTIPLVDMYFLSRISDSAAAAVGAITPLVFVANAFLIVSAFAGASIASQRIGANDYARGNATIAAYAIFVFMLALIAAFCVNVGGPMVASAMSLSPDVEAYARTYLSIIGWMVALWGCRVIYQTILNIYGEPKWNTFSNIILFVTNIIGCSIAVYGFMDLPPTGDWAHPERAAALKNHRTSRRVRRWRARRWASGAFEGMWASFAQDNMGRWILAWASIRSSRTM